MRVVTTSKHPLWHQMPTHTQTHAHKLWVSLPPSRATLSSYISISSGHRNNVCPLLSTGSRLFASVWHRPHLISACIFIPLFLLLCLSPSLFVASQFLFICVCLCFSQVGQFGSWFVCLFALFQLTFGVHFHRHFPRRFHGVMLQGSPSPHSPLS